MKKLGEVFREFVLAAVNPSMAAGAQSDEVVHIHPRGGLIRPRVKVMRVQVALALLGATAANALVAITREARRYGIAPFLRLVHALAVWRHTTTPSRIFCACLASDSGGGAIASLNVVLDEPLADRASVDVGKRGDLVQRHASRDVVLAEPVGVLVGRTASVMAYRIDTPHRALADPVAGGSASAFTDGRISDLQSSRRSSPLSLECFANGTRLDAPTLEQHVDAVGRNPIFTSEGLDAKPCSVRQRCQVAANDLISLRIRQLAVVFTSRHSEEVKPMGAHSVLA